MTNRLLHIDAVGGVAGDMLVGALLDAGLDFDTLRHRLSRLAVSGYKLAHQRVWRHGFAATQFMVTLVPGAAMPHRGLNDILAILDTAGMPDRVRQRAGSVFIRLAEAEARVHGTTPQQIHFHEVGAVDAIIDVAGVCWGLELLGIDALTCSPLPMGTGLVRCEHGLVPVPAPATVELLRTSPRAVPTVETNEPGEMTTPTGAALVTTLAQRFGGLPAMTISAVGYGAGSRQGQTRPNIVRAIVGEVSAAAGPVAGLPPTTIARGPAGSPGLANGSEFGDWAATPDPDGLERDTAWVVETNLDDLSGQITGDLFSLLLEAGALDVWVTATVMKKNRPGVCLSVLVPDEADAAILTATERLIFTATTTFGVRRYRVVRRKLPRTLTTVKTPYGVVRIKVGHWAGQTVAAQNATPTAGRGVITQAPEFEDCRELARQAGVAVRQVWQAALAAAQTVNPPGVTSLAISPATTQPAATDSPAAPPRPDGAS